MSLLPFLMGGGSSGGGGGTTSYLTLDSSVHVHFDANSIYQWTGIYPPIEQVSPLPALATSTGITYTNTSIPGQSWAGMTSAATDVDGAYVAGKTNVLFRLSETTNSVFNDGKTAAGAVADYLTYINARLAAHPWEYVVMFGTIPRGGTAGDATNNQRLKDADATIAADLATHHLDAFFGFRDLSPYFQPGTSREGFMALTTTCRETTAPYIHPIGSARDLIASRVAYGLQHIPV